MGSFLILAFGGVVLILGLGWFLGKAMVEICSLYEWK